MGFPGGPAVKNSLQHRRPGFDPWVRKIPWRRKWQPTPVFLPGESHGQRSLAGCCPRGHKESDKTEHRHTDKEDCRQERVSAFIILKVAEFQCTQGERAHGKPKSINNLVMLTQLVLSPIFGKTSALF